MSNFCFLHNFLLELKEILFVNTRVKQLRKSIASIAPWKKNSIYSDLKNFFLKSLPLTRGLKLSVLAIFIFKVESYSYMLKIYWENLWRQSLMVKKKFEFSIGVTSKQLSWSQIIQLSNNFIEETYVTIFTNTTSEFCSTVKLWTLFSHKYLLARIC